MSFRVAPYLAFFAASLPAFAENPAGLEFFEKKIRPILSENCYGCHAADTKAAGDLRVDDINGLLAGGKTGPAIVPGDPDKSLLIQRVITKQARQLMPRESDPLKPEQIADLRTWITDGAAWPPEKIPADLGRSAARYEELKKSHWAWQPLSHPTVPSPSGQEWAKGEVDRFILAKLDQEKLAPVADADPVTLIRRLTFDLTGLPPSPETITRFIADHSPAAYEKEVDHLLASPAFGERWGRHWLDIARYGESTGPSRNIPYPYAWKYRDYVLDAVNRDIPFDRFVREQIAGDLMPAADAEERDRLLTATGYLALGVKDVNQRFKVRFEMDNVDEQIDTVSRSILATTVSCARCHDHKFDPIPTKDYYSLAGIFTSTDDGAGVRNKMGGNGLDYYDPGNLIKLSTTAPPPPPAQVADLEAKVKVAKDEWDAIRGTPQGLARAANGQPAQRPFRLKYERLQGELAALTDPAARGETVHGVREGPKIADTAVRIRGEAERLGPVVPRGFLTAFEVPGADKVNPTQSGRLELAQWLTSPENPLTPRVVVNRIWLHLFGQGIVTTADNFGTTGAAPSHPELLDFLARRFIEGGWSQKELIRTLVLSHAYQLGSESPDDHRLKDPDNHLLWRHSPRRMEAEEVRDAILASNGRLQGKPIEDPAVKKLRMIELRDNGAEAKNVHDQADRELSRSVYLPLLRGMTPRSLEAFDPVSQTLVTGQREATTVPTQALFFLNSSFVREQALAFARRLVQTSGDTAVRELYLRVLNRPATDAEITRAADFIHDFAASWKGALPPVSTPQPDALAANTTTDNGGAADVPPNPDDMPRTDLTAVQKTVTATDPRSAAWMAFIQALYASAEFRFIR